MYCIISFIDLFSCLFTKQSAKTLKVVWNKMTFKNNDVSAIEGLSPYLKKSTFYLTLGSFLNSPEDSRLYYISV